MSDNILDFRSNRHTWLDVLKLEREIYQLRKQERERVMDANPNQLERERLRAALRQRPIPIPTLAIQLGVSPTVIEAFISSDANIVPEVQTRLAAILASSTTPATVAGVRAPARTPAMRKPMPTSQPAHPTLNARSLKCTAVLDANELAAYPRPADSVQRVVFAIAVAGGRTLTADIAAKAIRKAKKTISENGVENVALILQGKLTDGSEVHEAGLVAQVKIKQEKEKENDST